ncbi:hypothetical protein [Microbacterium sp.]|uniref:hypothetical protein n=1 Tax=Microbacterium sp. TaxID=51671 RepID=UPI00391CC87C
MECNPTSIACQLGRIADSTSGFDWDGFWATLLATIVGAVVAAGIGLYVARSERPQPFFRAETARSNHRWRVSEGVVTIEVFLWNIGDGPAYDVNLAPCGGVSQSAAASVAKLEPGASLSCWILVNGGGAVDYDAETGVQTDLRTVDWPAAAAASVSWQQPPQRGKVRRLTLKLDDPTPAV